MAHKGGGIMIYHLRDKQCIYATIQTEQPLNKHAKDLIQSVIDEYKLHHKNWTPKDILSHLHNYFDFEEIEQEGDEFEL